MSDSSRPTLGVLGAGSWGTALALVLARNGCRVRLWAHRAEHAEALQQERCNRRYLPEAAFPEALSAHASLDEVTSKAAVVLVAVPSRAFATVLAQLSRAAVPPTRVLWATKGLDAHAGGLLHQVAATALPDSALAAISGPSFAREVAAGHPTAVTVASRNSDFAERLAALFHSETFRVYTTRDIVGVELGAAVKNVLAIATGISDGLGFGANARAGLITRGLAEIRRLGRAMGAEDQTFMGLAGVGDLILTCTDDQSRNRQMGLALGRGQGLAAAEAEIGQTVEGVRTAGELHELAASYRVESPICAQVRGVVTGAVTARLAAHNLLAREPRPEPE